MAAMITSLATGLVRAEGNVNIRQKQQVDRAGLPINFCPSTSPYTGMTESRALRTGTTRDDAARATPRQKASEELLREEDGALRKTGPFGQDSTATIVSPIDIERLQMIKVILDIRDLYEPTSLIGRDLARTHGHVMDMVEAGLQGESRFDGS